MLNIGLFILAVALLAYGLGWRPKLDNVRAVIAAAWAGVLALVKGGWNIGNAVRIVTVALGIVLLVVALVAGGSSAGPVSSGSPHDNLDSAIRTFQSSAGLTPDGIFGKGTVKAFYGHN